jgi:hypothetical protein
MLAKVFSATTIGLEGELIEVEVDVASSGFPTFTIVGLPNKAIDEAKDRIRTAIINSSFEMPDSRLTVNLAPADLPKEGSAFDLPMAVGILAAMGMIKRDSLLNSLFIGELSLDGKMRKVAGVLPITLLAKKKKIINIFVPRDNLIEASIVDGLNVYPVDKLVDLVLHLNGQKPINPAEKIDLQILKDVGKSTQLPVFWIINRWCCLGRFALPIIPSPVLDWWAVAAIPNPARLLWRIAVFCFWMNFPNSPAPSLNPFVNRLRMAKSLSPVPKALSPFLPALSF